MMISSKIKFTPFRWLKDKVFVSPADIGYAYNDVSSRYEWYFLRAMHQYNDQLLDHLLSLISIGNPIILDIACGTGYNSYYIRQQLPRATLFLTDISQGMLMQAKRRVTPPVQYYLGDMLEELHKFPNRSFDAIVCSWAIKYHRPHAVIAQCKRVLKPGGYLAVMLNTKDTLPEIRRAYSKLLVNSLQHINKIMLPLPNPFNRKTFDLWFRRAGFAKVSSCQDEYCFHFANSEMITEFITSTGALAGYDKMLNLKAPELRTELTNILTQNEVTTVTHRFVWGIYQKR